MNHNSFVADWSSTRKRIYQRFIGSRPQHRREPLDLAELIHSTFPEWSWLEIAGWIDGSGMPTAIQQITLMHWEQAFDEPHLSLPRENIT
ncbi:MAG: hypothetical protein JWN70_1600 [Planctomycetaceae bacterium]|nr:hypothetical protein [Planctomycetaceae bacterium]